MKTMLIMLISLTICVGVSAQRKGYYHVYAPRVYVSPFSYGIGLGYPYFGYPFYGYPSGYGSRQMPYKLSLEIQSIKVDYKNKIREARKNKNVTHAQKRQEIRTLKTERDQEIIDAQRNYRSSRMNNRFNGNNNSQNQYHDNSSSGDNSVNQQNNPS